MPSTYGWVTIAEADEYFSTRLGSDAYWVSGTNKAAALQTAYNDLNDSGLFVLPTTANDKMKRAQFEQALFRLIDLEGIDSRTSLIAQGVTESDVSKEVYAKKNGIPVCAYAGAALEAYAVNVGIGSIELDRDDDDGVRLS